MFKSFCNGWILWLCIKLIRAQYPVDDGEEAVEGEEEDTKKEGGEKKEEEEDQEEEDLAWFEDEKKALLMFTTAMALDAGLFIWGYIHYYSEEAVLARSWNDMWESSA